MNRGEFAGLYVHVPFCLSRCAYCDFYSQTDLSLESGWLKALNTEAQLYKDRFAPFDSLYVGGGTPSLLSDRVLKELIHCLREHFSVTDGAEFTLEANPDDVTPGKLAVLLDLGVNRISLGVQSFDDHELRFLNRRHSAFQAKRAIEWIKRSGVPKVGLDLIYGLPGQTRSAWLRTLQQAAQFDPEHISCYQLTIEAHTPLGLMRGDGKIRPLGEEDERSFFILTSAFLEERDYLHYEISNFAMSEKNKCRHNIKYWQHVPYLGLGPSAHSYRDGVRWWNHRSVEIYCLALAQGLPPVAGGETLSEDEHLLERLMLGFRTKEGVSLDEIRGCPQADSILRQLIESGVVVIKGDRINPTRQGYLVADSLPLLFAT
jgi:putative oxygen-independent coproporphyrinogen III oxidase